MNRLLSPAMLLLLTVSSTLGCNGCDGGEVGTLTPDFQFSDALDFGAVLVGTRSTQVLVVRNRGNGRGTIRIESPGGAFTRLSPREVTIAAGTQTDVVLEVAPTTAGILQVDLVLTLEDAQRVRLTANAVAAPDCDDENDCTDETFDIDSRLCIYTQRVGECDDGNACSENDRCLVGVCIGDRFACDDGIDCTIDGCDVDVGCVIAFDDNRCNDDDACTQDVCGIEGCGAVPLPEGGRCGAGVECVVAEVCLQGVCTSVPLFEGAPCEAGDICTSEGTCVAGQCEPRGVAPISGQVTSERTFLSPHKISNASPFNQAAYAQGRLFVIENDKLSVATVSSDGYSITKRLSLAPVVASVLRVDESTLAVVVVDSFQRALQVLDVADPDNPTVLRTHPLPSSPYRLFVDGETGLGFCVLIGAGQNWFHLAEPRTDIAPATASVSECEGGPALLLGVGGAVVAGSTDGGFGHRVLSFDGSETAPISGLQSVPISFVGAFSAQGRAVYVWSEGTFIVDVVNPVIGVVERSGLPPFVKAIAGVFRDELFVTTTNGDLARLDVLDGSVESESLAVVEAHERARVVADPRWPAFASRHLTERPP